MLIFIIDILPLVAFLVREAGQIVFFIISVAAGIPPFVQDGKQIVPLVVGVAVLRAVTINYSFRQISLVIEGLLGCQIRIGDKIHTAFIVICHQGLVSKSIRLLRHLAPFIIAGPDTAPRQLCLGDIACLVIIIILNITVLIREACTAFGVGNRAFSPVRHRLGYCPAQAVILILQIDIAGKVSDLCKPSLFVVSKAHLFAHRICHGYQELSLIGKRNFISQGICST